MMHECRGGSKEDALRGSATRNGRAVGAPVSVYRLKLECDAFSWRVQTIKGGQEVLNLLPYLHASRGHELVDVTYGYKQSELTIFPRNTSDSNLSILLASYQIDPSPAI